MTNWEIKHNKEIGEKSTFYKDTLVLDGTESNGNGDGNKINGKGKQGILDSTVKQYRQTFNILYKVNVAGKQLGDYPINEITEKIMQSVFDEITTYSKTVVSKCRLLAVATFKLAVSEGFISANPMERVSLRFQSPDDKLIWSIEHYNKMLEFAEVDGIFGLPAYIMLVTGIRSNEIRALKPSDYNAADGYFYISRTVKADENQTIGTPKNGKARYVIVRKEHRPFIERELAKLPQDEYILRGITNEKGLNYTTDKEFRNRYNEFFERLNENRDKDNTIKPHSPHSTRHTYITLRLADGDSKWAVMEMAGHRELRVTLKYTRMSNFDVLKHALNETFIFLKNTAKKQNRIRKTKKFLQDTTRRHPDLNWG